MNKKTDKDNLFVIIPVLVLGAFILSIFHPPYRPDRYAQMKALQITGHLQYLSKSGDEDNFNVKEGPDSFYEYKLEEINTNQKERFTDRAVIGDSIFKEKDKDILLLFKPHNIYYYKVINNSVYSGKKVY